MIRILHSVSNMDRAGIETMLMNYYRNIDRSKIQFDFLCNKRKEGDYDKEIIALGGKIYHTPGLNPINFKKYIEYMDKLFLEYPEYKVIHVHNGALGVYALFAAKRNKIPYRIFHAHGASITIDIKWPLKMICKSKLLDTCNIRWACSKEAAKCYFGKSIILDNSYEIVNNAIDIEHFRYSDKKRVEIRNRYNIQNNIVIGHVGRFMKQKNHKFLIKVFESIHKIESKAILILLGEGELMNKIKEEIARKKLEKYVMFMGNISNVDEWYQAFDAFVLPSIWEGLPVVGVEAQTASLPCFFSDRITKEVKVSSNVFFMSLNDAPVLWASKILQVVKENKRIDCSEKIIEAGFDIKTEANKLEKKYKCIFEGI